MEQWPSEHILPLQPPAAAAEPMQVPAGGMRPGFLRCGPLVQTLLHGAPGLSLQAQPALSEPAAVHSGRGRDASWHGSGRPPSTHSASEGGTHRPRSLEASHPWKRSRLEGEPDAARQRVRRPRQGSRHDERGPAGRRAAGPAPWPRAQTCGRDVLAAGAAPGLPGSQCRSRRHLEQLYSSPDARSGEAASDAGPGQSDQRSGAARHRRNQHARLRFLDAAAGTGGGGGGAGSWTSSSAESGGRCARSGHRSGARSSARPGASELGAADSRQMGAGPASSDSHGHSLDAAAADGSDTSRGPGMDELDRDFLADEGLAPDEAGTLQPAA